MVTMQPAMTGAQASAPSGLRECVQERTESADCCPACGQRGALVPLGMRYDYPHRWRPWSVCATPLALCGWCDALVVGAATGASARETVPCPLGRLVLDAVQEALGWAPSFPWQTA